MQSVAVHPDGNGPPSRMESLPAMRGGAGSPSKQGAEKDTSLPVVRGRCCGGIGVPVLRNCEE